MKQLIDLIEKLKVHLKPSYIGFLLAIILFFFLMHYLTESKDLVSKVSAINLELMDRKNEVERLQAELDSSSQKIKEMETQAAATTEKATQDQAKIEELDAISKKYSDLTTALESPKLKIISLITTDPESKAHGKFFWIPGLKTANVLVTGLKSNDDTSEYQLWMVQQGAVNLNLMGFKVESAETKMFKLEDLPITDPKKLSSILITREPKGGSSRPSGTRVLSGKL